MSFGHGLNNDPLVVPDHSPRFFRAEDGSQLANLRSTQPQLRECDQLYPQLEELVKSLNPSCKFTEETLAAAVKQHLDGTAIEEYGVWVWYPWSQTLIHMLDEREFIQVRTDRNRNKITTEEQSQLSDKRVGVIGLSVGREVSMTMALERCFGEIRLADHDHLDLSNLNRLRGRVQDLGLNKAVLAARNIAEIDPFLKVTVFRDGLTRENMDAFFNDGGKLDLLIEECDSVDVKIFSRHKAKELRIPVVMDTSDKGMLDIERFDLEPERPILHGLIDHLDPADAAKAKTNEEKIPFVLPIIGLDTMSKRMKASMLEIENSVGSWPQLASSVALGGAVTTDVARRILLEQHQASGRWFLDLNTTIGNDPFKLTNAKRSAPIVHTSRLDGKTMEARVAKLSLRIAEHPITETIAKQLVKAAILAPSAGNMQPWKFLLDQGRLFIFNDSHLGRSELDGGSLLPHLDTGTCLENMMLMASKLGLDIKADTIDELNDELIAVVQRSTRSDIAIDPLVDVIAMRCTNRRKTSGTPLKSGTLEDLTDSVTRIEGASVTFLTDKQQIETVAELVGAAERIRVLNPIGHQELLCKEVRWTEEEVELTRDGLDIKTFELTLAEQAGMRVAADPKAIELLNEWGAGAGFKKLSGDGIRTASAIALISFPEASNDFALSAGRVVQRLWLAATKAELAVHPISAPILLSHHVLHGGGVGFSPSEQQEVLRLGQATRELFKLGDREPMFMVRLGRAAAPTTRSLRRRIDQFYFTPQPVEA